MATGRERAAEARSGAATAASRAKRRAREVGGAGQPQGKIKSKVHWAVRLTHRRRCVGCGERGVTTHGPRWQGEKVSQARAVRPPACRPCHIQPSSACPPPIRGHCWRSLLSVYHPLVAVGRGGERTRAAPDNHPARAAAEGGPHPRTDAEQKERKNRELMCWVIRI